MRDGKLIAIVLPNLGGGGVERVRLLLAKEFLARGYAVDLVLFKRSGGLLDYVPENVRVVELSASSIRGALLPLVRYLTRERPAALLVAMWPLTAISYFAAKLARSRATLVLSEHTTLSSSTNQNRRSRLLLRLFGRRIYSGADAVVCVSDGARMDLCRTTSLHTHQVTVIHNPVDQTQAVGQAPQDLLNWWRSSPSRVLAAGRLASEKDFGSLLHAFSIVRGRVDARLIILGEGPQRAALDQLKSELGLEEYVALPGFVPTIQPYLREASLFVLSSRFEGLGNVITEALLEGVPVVSTDCPSGPAELLENGRYGLLVEPGDPVGLAQAMVSSLEATHDRDSLRRRGREFDPVAAATKYLQLLDPAAPEVRAET
jgi:glycosyltransferase involved in cell wall biosynthesis